MGGTQAGCAASAVYKRGSASLSNVIRWQRTTRGRPRSFRLRRISHSAGAVRSGSGAPQPSAGAFLYDASVGYGLIARDQRGGREEIDLTSRTLTHGPVKLFHAFGTTKQFPNADETISPTREASRKQRPDIHITDQTTGGSIIEAAFWMQGGGDMDNILRYRSLEAFCRQRARTEGESCDAWLEKAEIFARLANAESRSKTAEENDEEKKSSREH